MKISILIPCSFLLVSYVVFSENAVTLNNGASKGLASSKKIESSIVQQVSEIKTPIGLQTGTSRWPMGANDLESRPCNDFDACSKPKRCSNGTLPPCPPPGGHDINIKKPNLY